MRTRISKVSVILLPAQTAAIPDGRRRSSLLANFLPIKAPGRMTEFTAQFNIVLGGNPGQP